MMVSILLPILVFGVLGVFTAVFVFSIVSKRLWILPAAVALVFFAFIGCGLLVSIFSMRHTVAVQMPAQTQIAQQFTMATDTVMQGPPKFNASISGSPSWILILIVVLLIASLCRLFGRKGMSPACGHGFRRAWPVLAVILFIAFMLLGTVRTQYSVSQSSSAAAAARQAAENIAAQQRAIVATQKQFANQVRMQQHLVQSDIHAEMDQFDAPRIQLPPNRISPKAPDAPAATTAPASPAQPAAAVKPNNEPAAKTSEDDAKKPAASSNQKKRKRSDKAPATGDTKQSKAIAQSKSATDTIALEEKTPSSGKPATVAEADPEKSKARPRWVDESPKRTGNTLREVIATEPYATVDECYQAADVYLLLKTYQRIQELAGKPYSADGALPSVTFQDGKILADGFVISYGRSYPYWADERIRALANMDIGTDYVRREIVAKDPKDNESREYIETVESSIGPMKKLYLQIEFTPAVDRELRRHWDAHERRERFAMVGTGSFSILGILGFVFALLKIDTATKGYYTKRLFIGVPLAILGMFGLYAMLVEMGAKLPH